MDTDQRFYKAVVEEVHSGDDLILLVDLGIDGLFKRVRARLRGVDTPSAFRTTKESEASEIRDSLRLITSRGDCSIELHSHGRGGWLVTLYVSSKGSGVLNVNELLISRGYVYQGKQEPV